ncbi:MAG: hypothetical protein WAM54_08260, partial [Nitrososphaeraceae archaeon]
MTHIKDMTYLIRDLMSSLMLSHGSLTIPLFIGLVLTSTVIASITINPVQAETGKGTDVFKVIMTIFGVEESKG